MVRPVLRKIEGEKNKGVPVTVYNGTYLTLSY